MADVPADLVLPVLELRVGAYQHNLSFQTKLHGWRLGRRCAHRRSAAWPCPGPGVASTHLGLSRLWALCFLLTPRPLFLKVVAEQGLEPGAAVIVWLLQAWPAAGEGYAGVG